MRNTDEATTPNTRNEASEGFGVLCGRTHIAPVDAERMLSIVENDQLAATASTVRQRPAAAIQHAAESKPVPRDQPAADSPTDPGIGRTEPTKEA
jgi:hypothetical protein